MPLLLVCVREEMIINKWTLIPNVVKCTFPMKRYLDIENLHINRFLKFSSHFSPNINSFIHLTNI